MGSDASNGGIARSGVSGSYTYAVKVGFENKPATYVSFYDSLRYSNWLNNGQGSADTETGAYTLAGGTAAPSNGLTVSRNAGANIFLPSVNEWYKAAYYDPTLNGGAGGYFDYPTGTNAPTTCTTPAAGLSTANCEFPFRGAVTNAGAYTGSASPYGTYDQGGNVWEWNERIVDGSLRGARGGSWNSPALGLAASDPNPVYFPTIESGAGGFRVASLVPEPGTGLLVMTGVLGMALRRRRTAKAL